ncbi:MAG: sulfatase-like hydrolase/transferase, partial [Hyphomicrobium sp.]
MVVGRFLELGWSGRAVLVAKLFGLAGIFVLAPWGWVTASIERAQLLGAAGSFGVLALYVAVLIVSYIAVVVSPFLRHTQSRVVFAFLGLVGFAVDLVVRDVTGSSLKIDMMQTLWQERAQAAGAFDAYAHTITAVLPAVACLFAASAIAPPRTFSLDLRYAVFPILALGLAVELMYVTREDVISEIPSPVSAPAQFVMAASSGVRYRGARDAVSYPKAVEPRFKNIVYIVDESIRADYLGVNNPRINNTPFLNSVSGKIANFGVAISSTNCSRGARYILRTGLREDQLPDANEVGLHQPSIWQYAKYAGFRTLHLDAFSSFDPMHSFMNEAESKSIDSVIEPKPEPFWELDRRVADALVKALEASDQPKFIFVEKFGLHPPWKRSLPESFQFDVSGVESLPAKLSNAQKRKVGTYLKGVRWSVDLFFELTYKALSRTDTLVIYTSDHG